MRTGSIGNKSFVSILHKLTYKIENTNWIGSFVSKTAKVLTKYANIAFFKRYSIIIFTVSH